MVDPLIHVVAETMPMKSATASNTNGARICRRNAHRWLLLAGVSALAMAVHATPADAVCLGRCGGGGAASATAAAANSAIMSAQQAAAATEQSMNSLSRATQAVQAMQAAQTAAHNLALSAPSSVPNGLVSGGLVPDSGLAAPGVANSVLPSQGGTWIGLNTPTQTTSGGETLVTIVQTQQKAIANWSSFNVGTNTEVYFNQSQGNSSAGNGWIVLNRVTDPSGVPSQILGQIRAEGSVYIINANGIIFGGGSQINVSSLIASSLNLFSNTLGDANTPGSAIYRFLNGGIGDLNASNFATNSILLTTNNPNAGNITIQPGASINLASNGLAVIAAPNVTNSGTITAPSGQVALIAGIGVSYTYNYYSGVGEPQGYTNNSSTLLIFSNTGQITNAQGADITPVGALVNNGLIFTPRGNITLLGGTVAQNGVAVATTSVQQAGSIVLTSQYDNGSYTGQITFGPQAVTAILPDTNGITLASDATSLAPFSGNPYPNGYAPVLPIQGPGTINIIGQAIDFQGGALVYAPGQTITAQTLVLPDPRPMAPQVAAPGRILLENGAVLDVSGIPDTVLPADYNLLTVKLGGNELADSPLQQNDFLYGQSVTVDMRLTGTNSETGESWVGTPLANLSGYLNLEQQGIGQLLVNGGTIRLGANEFVGTPGSIIDLMGGYVEYQAGILNTTNLVGADGRIYNIGSANPNMTYVGIAGQFTVDHNSGGKSDPALTQIYSTGMFGPQYQPDYIQGGNAGTLNINLFNTANGSSGATVANSGALILESDIMASAVAGLRQVASGALPSNATFNFSGVLPIEIGDPSVLSTQSTAALSTPANFSAASPLLATPGSPYAAATVFNSQVLDSADFDKIALATLGASAGLVEDAGTSLTVQPGGSISLSGGNVTINGNLTARAGSISITTQPVTAAANIGVPADLVIGSSAVLNVSGLFYIDLTSEQAAAPLVNGGSIALVTNEAFTAAKVDETGNITLAPGSVLNLNSGGHMLASGALQLDSTTGTPVGRGGNLTLATYQGVETPPAPGLTPSRGRITVGGTIDAFGFDNGGTLTLQAVSLQIGGNAATAPAYAYYFDPVFWGDRGFDNFVLSAVTNAEVPAGAIVRLTHANLLPDVKIIGDTAYAPVGFLTGTQLSPTNLSITAGVEETSNGGLAFVTPSANGDDAGVGVGAQILADPGANISIASLAMVTVYGAIHAPGGSISLAVNYPDLGPTPLGPLYLGPQSVIDVSGVTVINPQPATVPTLGGSITPQTGKVLAGGTVSLFDDWAPILVAPGAVINVSGASGAFDVPQLVSGGPLGGMREVVSRQPVWSDAGTVKIQGQAGLLLEGTLIGEPGAPQAQGGTLTITADNVFSNGGPSIWLVPDTAAALVAAKSPFNFATYVPLANGGPTLFANEPGGVMLLGADSLNGSGFSNLALNGTGIGFTGQISLTLNGSFSTSAGQGAGEVPSFVVNPTTAASLSITAPYIFFGGGVGAATAGATATFNAQALDISGLASLSNIGQATFNSTGDIRLLPQNGAVFTFGGTPYLFGSLTSTGSGNVTFAAADVYPATDTAFLIQVGSANSTVTFTYPTGGRPSSATPLSAGGAVWVNAPTIIQNGEIQAPFGSIMLGFTNNSVLGTRYNNIPTQSVTLGAGSITSVSANGTVIPYGSTVDQTTWVYNPALTNPAYSSSSSLLSSPLTGAPQGVVTLTAAGVTVSSGAVINLAGGGDLQAQEWVPGTGGSRNLLLQYQTSYQNSTTGQQVPTYADGRQIFAILPGYSSPVAPYDATLSQSGMTAGQAIYLSGGNGLAAGYYTLLPAQYATLPGAYRVVVNSGVTNPLYTNYVLPDGTIAMAGSTANLLSGTRSSTIEQFYLQPASVWGQYSQYALTSANSFFPSYAAINNLAAPVVPNDAGRLVIAAATGLTLNGKLDAAPGPGGFGAQVDISAQNIAIVDHVVPNANGSTTTTIGGVTYLEIGADQLDALGATSLLIGGTRSFTSAGMIITPTANGVIVANDAQQPLQAPEIMLVAAPTFQNQTVTLDKENNTATISVPVAGTGQVLIQSGSVVEAMGGIGPGEPTTIIMGSTLANLPSLPSSALVSEIQSGSIATLLANYYSTLNAALGTLVRVSNGNPVTVQLPSLAQLNPTFTVTDNVNTGNTTFTPVLPSLGGATGSLIQSGAQVLGGNSLTLASTGNTQIQGGALISGNNILANSSQITFVGSGTSPASGLVINPVQVEGAQTVDLQSASTIAFAGNVVLQSTGSLTLSAGALSSDGGTVSISAPTLVLDNELGATVPSFAAGAGTLNINVGELVFGTGTKTLTGFGALSVVANQGVVGQGTGSMNFGSLPLTLQTPVVIADTGSTQIISTTAADINLVPLAGATAMSSNALGGAITFETLQSGSITVSVPIQALAGNISLLAGVNGGTTGGGNVTVTGGGQLIAHGVAVPFFDVTEYAPGGAITLSANQGTVSIQSGAVVDFSGASGGGNGGSLAITATGTAPVAIASGTLFGATAPGYNGSSFSLNTGGPVVLDTLAQILNGAGVTGGISVQSGQGNLSLTQTLTAQTVQLVANGGLVNIAGTINASGAAGGTIDLFGTTGVTVSGNLLAIGTDPNQLGGTVEIGTSARFTSGNYNPAYGYEAYGPGDSGTITIAPSAVINVSGGSFDGLSGGTVLIRAPLLYDGTVANDGKVNVTLAPNAFQGARSVTLEAYAVWSTADSTTGALHFDGIIDPAGWYNSSGTLLPGSFVNAENGVVATWNGTTLTNQDGTTNNLAYYLNTDYFTPNALNTDSTRTAHETFYGYVNGDSTAAAPGTLMGFVKAPVAAGQGFQSIAGSGSIANFQETPGIELDNPTSANVNGGNISVLSNWNLGAENASGNLVFRYNGAAPALTVRAGGNIAINASISDGFVQPGGTLFSAGQPTPPSDTYADALSLYNSVATTYSSSTIAGLSYLTPALLAVSVNNDTTTGLAIQGPSQLSNDSNDPYYQLWENYEARYTTFYNDLTNPSLTSHYSPTGLTTATSPTGVITNNLKNAINTLNADASFTTLTQYATYLTAYSTYAAAYLRWASSNTIGTRVIAYLIQPPAPPPAIPYVAVPVPTFAQANSPNVMTAIGNQAAIAGMALSNEASSTSYQFVAGAAFGSADPLELNLATSSNITIGQHTTLQPNINNAYYIVVPTIVRTGAGSIDIAASGNFALTDPLAPGVVYTAGEAPSAPTASNAATIAIGDGLYATSTNVAVGISTILTSAVNAYGAGNITINALGNITGIENVTDTLAKSGAASGLTSAPGSFVGQFWDAWLLSNPANPNIPWYVNFGSFDQGIMSVGGNVTVRAGGNISDLAVSLPTTGFLDTSNTLHLTGGGNLSVTAGGNIYSGDFYVGQGAGTINAGGAIVSDFNFTPVIDPTHTYPVATLLAVQYGTIGVNARTSVDIGGVYDPTYLWAQNLFSAATTLPVASIASTGATPADLMPYVTSMSAGSGVSLQATGSNLTFNSLLPQADLFALGANLGTSFAGNAAAISSLLLPASLNLVALAGGISVDHGGGLYPSATGTLSLIANQSINLSVSLIQGIQYEPPVFPVIGNVFGYTLGKLDYPVGTGILPTASDPTLLNVWTTQLTQMHDPALITATQADPVVIESLNGSLVDGTTFTKNMGTVTALTFSGSGSPIEVGLSIPIGSTVDQISLIPNAPALIHVGKNITDLPFYGENFAADNITSIIAGGNISSNIFGAVQTAAIELAGPGTLDVIAGGNITFGSQRLTTPYETGIRTLGNSIDTAAYPIYGSPAPVIAPSKVTTTVLADFGNPYLPTGGASVNVLFGVGPGMNTAGFIAAYINPATAGVNGSAYANDLVSFVTQYESQVGSPVAGSLTPAQAFTIFQTLPASQQQLLVEQVFFDVLNTTGLNYNNPSSPGYKQYSAGYEAINTLFPAFYGYTANALGSVNGANQLVQTGTLDMRGSTIQTQQGGNISILGPGGRILVGSAGAAPAVNPANEGILTLEKGNIDIFADQSVLVAQSRIMTEQGGSILMWSSNGNLDAGEGAKTSVSAPPPKFACDVDYRCSADIKGQVSGAGIATLQSLPGVPVGDANLMAPRGIINFGAAGVRVSGNLNLVAPLILNAFNVTVQGTIMGLPTFTGPSFGTLTTASNVAGAVQATIPVPSNANNNRASIIIVEVIGYGGGSDTETPAQPQNDKQHKSDNEQNYDPNSSFKLIGNGALTQEQQKTLTDEERSKLRQFERNNAL